MRLSYMITAAALIALPTIAQGQVAAQAEGRASARAEASHTSSQAGPSRSSQTESSRTAGQVGASGHSSAGAHGSANGQMSASAALDATVAAGLPEAPVRETIAQSEASGASAAETGRAAFETYTELRVAREALTRDQQGAREPSQREVTAGAHAMAHGAARADLETIRDAAPARRDLTASLNALASLEARGIGSAEAASAIASRLESGANDRAIASLGATASSTADLALPGVAAQGALDAAAGVSGALGGLGGGAGGALDAAAGVGGTLGGGLAGSAGMGAGVVGSLGGIIR